MIPVLTFKQAIDKTENEDRALLIGNGFSARYFNYSNLLSEADLNENGSVKALFERLGTVDFEKVINALENAVLVAKAYGSEEYGEKLEADAEVVRSALVNAVNTTHPAYRDDLILQYESAADFLNNFGQVFSLNYDLLLYWVNLEKLLLRDGFGKGDNIDGGRFRGPFHEDSYCEIFNLHGGLHLFEDNIGEVYKALNDGTGVVSNITREITEKKRLPLYVAEGTSDSKLFKINSVKYLRHCYQMLKEVNASIFVFGHSADENDAHIYRAIFSSKAKHVWFGVYQPNEAKVREFDAKLIGYKKRGGDKVPYSFFDSETAQVWDGDAD